MSLLTLKQFFLAAANGIKSVPFPFWANSYLPVSPGDPVLYFFIYVYQFILSCIVCSVWNSLGNVCQTFCKIHCKVHLLPSNKNHKCDSCACMFVHSWNASSEVSTLALSTGRACACLLKKKSAYQRCRFWIQYSFYSR